MCGYVWHIFCLTLSPTRALPFPYIELTTPRYPDRCFKGETSSNALSPSGLCFGGI